MVHNEAESQKVKAKKLKEFAGIAESNVEIFGRGGYTYCHYCFCSFVFY